jgi:uncharacterized iron-regulated protein
MKQTLITFLLATLAITITAQNQPEAYTLYDKNGQRITLPQLATAVKTADVVLFGELHNNPIVHWLQLELTKALHTIKQEQLILAAEMFESDDQLIINEYLEGWYSEKNFKQEMKLWNNYETDYKPLLEFAKTNRLFFCASNIPRRYASLVAKRGPASLDSLSKEAKSYIAPLPFPVDTATPGYAALIGMSHGSAAPMHFMHAQASKDATMAHFISEAYMKDFLVLHFNGDYHSKEYGGIYWYLKATHPKWNVVTISTVEAANQDYQSDYSKLADYIIVIPENMTKTY